MHRDELIVEIWDCIIEKLGRPLTSSEGFGLAMALGKEYDSYLELKQSVTTPSETA